MFYDDLTINFYPLTSKVAVIVNITDIVSSWIECRLRNKGIIIYGKSKCPFVNFGSVKNDDTNLIPFLDVYYEDFSSNKLCKDDFEVIISNICKDICRNKQYPKHPYPPNPYPPNPHTPNQGNFTDVNVIGNVAPYSVYNLVVEVEVTRDKTLKKDYYYISDTYINSSNPNILAINKNYQIAIVPKLKPRDTQLVNLYGSYKGLVIINQEVN